MTPRRWIGFSMASLLIAASSVASERIRSEKPEQTPWIGLTTSWHLDPRGKRFLLIERVSPQGPARDANMLPGDLIVSVDRHSIEGGDDLDFLLLLASHRPGDRLRFGTVRNGQLIERTVTLRPLPPEKREAWERGLATARARRADRQKALRSRE